MNNYLKADNYPNFGKRKPIPGLKNEKLHNWKNKIGGNIQLFTGGQYDRDGVSGAYAGFKGLASLYDGGDLELYGGVGNIAVAGAKYSQTIWQNDNVTFKGYVKAEGAVSLTDKKDFTIEHHVDSQSTDTQTGSVVAEGPGQVIVTDNYYKANRIEGNSIDGLDYGKIYHKTEFQHNYFVNTHNDVILTGDILASNFKTAFGAEYTYTNNKGNLELSIVGEIGLDSQLTAKSIYNQDCHAEQTLILDSSEYNEDAYFKADACLYDDNRWYIGYDSNLQSHESVTSLNKVDVGGFETYKGFDSKLYGALNSGLKYRTGKFQIGAEAGVKYSNKQFIPTFKAGVSYLLGNSPIIHNHGARVLFKKNPLSGEGVYLDKNIPKTELNLFTKAQAIDGVNGLAAGLEGKVPLNNVGTAMNISAGIGNILTADVNLSQTNPIVNNNWLLTSRIGAKMDYSLTKKDVLETDCILGEKELENSSTNIVFYEVHGQCIDNYNEPPHYSACHNITEKYEITSNNKSYQNAASLKIYGNIGVEYKKGNWSFGADTEIGLKKVYDNLKTSANSSDLDISSYEYKPEYVYYDNGAIYSDNDKFTNTCFSSHNIIDADWCEHYLLFDGHHYNLDTQATDQQYYTGDTHIGLNCKTNGTISYIPKFKPYANIALGAKYDFDNKNALRVGVNYDGQLGGQLTYTRKLK